MGGRRGKERRLMGDNVQKKSLEKYKREQRGEVGDIKE